jgi:glycosyltransferase involved in cell wall biosynthesis
VDLFIAPGDWVANLLVDRLGVQQDRVSVVAEFIDPPEPDPTGVTQLRRDLLGDGEAMVASLGSMTRRKGPERFVDLMRALSDGSRAVRGVWIGGEPTSVTWHETSADVERAGLGSAITMVPTVEDTVGHLAAADVVVSTAIEDPFPLAVLEAAACGVPVVGFRSGGLAEVLTAAGHAELVVEVGDLLGMADRVTTLLADPERRTQVGAALAAHVSTNHLTAQLAPRWWAEVQR